MNKRPIDLMRESGGAFKIESDDDNTLVQEMCKLNGGLALITKNAIYEVKLADQIDPNRENPNFPHNVRRRVLDVGADSPLVGQTLLTANALFKEKFLPVFVDTHKAVSLIFETLTDLVDMNIASEEFIAIEEKQIQSMKNRSQKSGSLSIPSISDFKQRTKSFVQKAEHVEQAIIDMILLFYPDISRGHFETVINKLKAKYDSDDDFIKFLESILPFMKMVRNARDCLDHRNAKDINVLNFKINPDGTIIPPTIEINNFRGTQLEATSLSFFMSNTIKNMLEIIENLTAFLCSKHVQPFGSVPILVGLIPENRRRNKFIRFGYCTNITGQWMPIG